MAQVMYKCPGEGEGGSTLYSEVPCLEQQGESIIYDESGITRMDSLSDGDYRTLRLLEQTRPKPAAKANAGY